MNTVTLLNATAAEVIAASSDAAISLAEAS